ncbi:hypothetical protein PAAG_11050 [Paracoccidioides lutzii Pb01]|uniref:Uncharacterized protein n=1 Tax=Paracoccidioides lutzii (strain ATCC MYA-826 / Pb01) TaxID=502779 RepID=A0A0A2V2U2_PARBA|nr:hypothetical protein PAAG_11050 [Paracoccidioides lutzii Pb01]KGQ02101.1 hypothetical protein PAAG_11050 [Paracoccidioides lutzii Pb01]
MEENVPGFLRTNQTASVFHWGEHEGKLRSVCGTCRFWALSANSWHKPSST